MSSLSNILQYTLFLAVVTVGVMLLLVQTDILPGYEVRIVQSGSMEPAISTGSVVVIREQASYAVGDVVTFGADTLGSVPTTHRIIADVVTDGTLAFVTQGDANAEADPRPVAITDIRGAVLFSVPVLGYIIDFARQPLGFVLLVGVPAGLIVFDEVSKIVVAIRRKEECVAEEVTEDTTTKTV